MNPPFTCRTCKRESDSPAPEKWIQKYPHLKDLCPECVSEWIIKNIPDDRDEIGEEKTYLK
jgi:hypothetical protein